MSTLTDCHFTVHVQQHHTALVCMFGNLLASDKYHNRYSGLVGVFSIRIWLKPLHIPFCCITIWGIAAIARAPDHLNVNPSDLCFRCSNSTDSTATLSRLSYNSNSSNSRSDISDQIYMGENALVDQGIKWYSEKNLHIYMCMNGKNKCTRKMATCLNLWWKSACCKC